MALSKCPQCRNRAMTFGKFLVGPTSLQSLRHECPHCQTPLVFSWRFKGLEFAAALFILIWIMRSIQFPALSGGELVQAIVLTVLLVAAAYLIVKGMAFAFGVWRIEKRPASAE